MEKQQRFKLSVMARKAARDAVTAHNGWDTYRKERRINSAMLSGELLFDAADALGIDLRKVIQQQGQDAAARAAKVLEGSRGTVAAEVDWQRVRAIARDEVAQFAKPVIVEKQVVITPQRRIDTGAMIKHPKFDLLLASVCIRDFSGNRLNAYLYGPTGTGKTFACAQIAELLGLEFYFHSTAMEAYDLQGYEKVSGELLVTQFVKGFEHGGVVLLDEMDRYDEKALTVINAALANGRMTLPNGREIKRHDNFICIGAGNTNGLGATADFTAAQTLDKSTLSRFPVKIAWGVSEELEDMAAANRSQNPAIAALWLTEIRAVRKALDRLGLPEAADQRCVEAGANMLAAGLSLETVRDCTYLAGWDKDQREAILNLSRHAFITEGQIIRAGKES